MEKRTENLVHNEALAALDAQIEGYLNTPQRPSDSTWTRVRRGGGRT